MRRPRAKRPLLRPFRTAGERPGPPGRERRGPPRKPSGKRPAGILENQRSNEWNHPVGHDDLTDAPNFGTKFGRRRPCLRYGVPLPRLPSFVPSSPAGISKGGPQPPFGRRRGLGVYSFNLKRIHPQMPQVITRSLSPPERRDTPAPNRGPKKELPFSRELFRFTRALPGRCGARPAASG